MKKYLYIFKYNFINELSYFSKVVFRVISYFLHIFMFYSVWSFIYKNGNNLINGYSFNQMMWYLIIAELFAMGVSRVARNRPIDDIKTGSITYIMNKPYSYIGQVFTSYLAEGLIRLIVMVPISIIMGLLFVGPIELFNFKYLLIMISSFILGYSINGLIQLGLSLFAFWIEDANPIHWVYSKILLIFGIMFPIDIFPTSLQNIVRFTPAYVVSYGPTRLIINYNNYEAIQIIGAQIIYLTIVLLFVNIIYKKGVKKLNVNGG